jgi:hypothetical protein
MSNTSVSMRPRRTTRTRCSPRITARSALSIRRSSSGRVVARSAITAARLVPSVASERGLDASSGQGEGAASRRGSNCKNTASCSAEERGSSAGESAPAAAASASSSRRSTRCRSPQRDSRTKVELKGKSSIDGNAIDSDPRRARNDPASPSSNAPEAPRLQIRPTAAARVKISRGSEAASRVR